MYFTFIWFHGQLVFHKQKKIEKNFPCSSQLAHFPGKGSPLACAGGRPGEPISPSLMILTCWSHTPGLLPDTLRDAIPTVNTKNLGTVGEASGRCHLASAGQEKPSSRADQIVLDNMGELESNRKYVHKGRNGMWEAKQISIVMLSRDWRLEIYIWVPLLA